MFRCVFLRQDSLYWWFINNPFCEIICLIIIAVFPRKSFTADLLDSFYASIHQPPSREPLLQNNLNSKSTSLKNKSTLHNPSSFLLCFSRFSDVRDERMIISLRQLAVNWVGKSFWLETLGKSLLWESAKCAISPATKNQWENQKSTWMW